MCLLRIAGPTDQGWGCVLASLHSTSCWARIMQKKSALTAALSGAQQPAPAPAATVAAPLANPNEDHYAFPCLLHAPDDGLATVEEGIEAMDLGHVTVVGSAPTNVLLPNGTPLVGSCTRSCIMVVVTASPQYVTLGAGGLPAGPL